MKNFFKTPKGTELPILVLKGKDYLQVAHRLVWFREEHPTWTIKTERVDVSDKSCLFRAEILDEHGLLISTAHKREHQQHFSDFEEKAETGSIGRALAHCGYGTQFAPDLDEGDRIVDSPTPPKPLSHSEAKTIAKVTKDTKPSPNDGEFVIEFGKPDIKGKKLKDLPEHKIRELLQWCQQTRAMPRYQVAATGYLKYLDLEKKLDKKLEASKTESYGEFAPFEEYDDALPTQD